MADLGFTSGCNPGSLHDPEPLLSAMGTAAPPCLPAGSGDKYSADWMLLGRCLVSGTKRAPQSRGFQPGVHRLGLRISEGLCIATHKYLEVCK